MINALKRINANPEHKVIVWYSHVQSHFRYASIIWNRKVVNWGSNSQQMETHVVKLLTVYNRLYKNMLNINTKLDNKTLAIMQGKNQLMNVVEYHSISAIMRLLMSNQRFHEGKEGTEETEP